MHTIIFITVQNLCHSHTSFIMGQLNTLLLITWIVLALFLLVSLHFCNGNTIMLYCLQKTACLCMHSFEDRKWWIFMSIRNFKGEWIGPRSKGIESQRCNWTFVLIKPLPDCVTTWNLATPSPLHLFYSMTC